MTTVACPACGSEHSGAVGAGGFHCKTCLRDVWSLTCKKCHAPLVFHGSATGTGTLEVRCASCRARNLFDKQRLRAIVTESKRLGRMNAAAAKHAAQAERAKIAQASQSMQSHVAARNQELHDYMDQLRSVLESDVKSPLRFDFSRLKVSVDPPTFEPGELLTEEPMPDRAAFAPVEPRGVAAHMPGARKQYEAAVQEGQARLQGALQARYERETVRKEALAQARAAFEARQAAHVVATTTQHQAVDEMERKYGEGDSDAITEYFEAVLGAISWPFERARDDRVAYSKDSRQLVVEVEMPDFGVVPEVREYKYIKSRNEESATQLPASQRRAIYASLIAQVALRVLNVIFGADSHDVLDGVVLNGHVETIDLRTGQGIHPCLVTLRTTREVFAALNLQSVEPAACLKGLNASVSKDPAELAPVRPVLEFDMVDPRFVTETDVLSELDARPNLMDLTPNEFESLITNLFEKMGLETRLTQASRDGGVDCVAFDSRPVLGGKVVIQAKRYKNTVGVSAVRDLFGTMQNEGASKGILVTTSGYGSASFTFAAGKPLELLDGANLLYLLRAHAGIEAVIIPPEDWSDPVPDQADVQ